MANNDNAHAVRLAASLKNHVGEDFAEKFAQEYPLSKSASIEKKFDWAKSACEYLDKHLDLDTIIRVRADCRCNDGKSIADKLSKYLNRSDSVRDFVAAFNQNETFAFLEYISDRQILFCYPQCYCSCVKRIPQQLSKAWCYCTLGNAKAIFDEVFKKDVKVSLRESIKTGAERCAIEVAW